MYICQVITYINNGDSMKFYKYQSCGNDFVLFLYQDVYHLDIPLLVKDVSSRHYGIGCDGVIIIKENPLEMIFFNKDGSEASMCGNGLRCFARYCIDYHLCDNQFNVLTKDGIKYIEYDSKIMMNMGKYRDYLEYNDFYFVHIGVDHIVMIDKDFSSLSIIAPKLIKQYQANINILKVIGDNHIEIRTYEKGVGLTYGCSSGACACAIIAQKLNLTSSYVQVDMLGGCVEVNVGEDIYIWGDAFYIFEGEYKKK